MATKDFSKGLVLEASATRICFKKWSRGRGPFILHVSSNTFLHSQLSYFCYSLEFGGKGGMLDAVLAGATVAARVDAAKALLKVIVVEGGISCEFSSHHVPSRNGDLTLACL